MGGSRRPWPTFGPRRIVGFRSCLHTTDDHALWDIEFTDWCPSATAGCLRYVRVHPVGDDLACA